MLGRVPRSTVVGVLAASAGCATDTDDPLDLGAAESALSTTVLTPIQGECTTVKSLNRMTLAGGDVIRGACSLTCKKAAYQMGIWNVSVVKPDGSAPSASNVGSASSGGTRAAQVDVPYAPGTYSVSCTTVWQEKQGSTSYFGTGGTYVGGPF